MPGGRTVSTAAAALACAIAALAATAPARAAEVVSTTGLNPRLEELTVRTDALAADTHVRVLLPADYPARPKRRSPVVYLLHAAMGDHTAWSKGLERLGPEGELPAIVVMPDGGESGFYSDWWNGGAGGPPRWEAFHVDQLLPLIDSRYRTRPGRDGRVLMGGSMGGFGAFSYAARHPDLFGGAISISGALDTNYPTGGVVVTSGPLLNLQPADSVFGPRTSQEVRWRAHNPVDLAENLRPLDLQIRTHSGRPGPGFAGFDGIEFAVHEMSVSMHQTLDGLGIGHEFRDYGPGDHSFATAKPAIIDAIAALAARIRSLPAAPPAFDHVAAEPRFSVWGWTFEADPGRALEFLRVEGAGRNGVTIVGSGTETVTTAPLFRKYRSVDVATAGATTRVKTTKAGRIRFAVALGPAHSDQQYTAAAVAAGQGKPGYFTSRTATFTPRQRRHPHHRPGPPGPP